MDWDQLLGWAGTTPRFSYKGTRYTFPTYVAVSAQVLALFNTYSLVCDPSGCGFKTECGLVKPSSLCATS